MNNINKIPIIAIDGTTASGKGSLSRKLAKHFNFNYLSSGALYRLTAYELKKKDFDFQKYHDMRKNIEMDYEKYILKSKNENNEKFLENNYSKEILEKVINKNLVIEDLQEYYSKFPEYMDMENMIVDTAKNLSPIFKNKSILVNDVDISEIILTQEYGNYAAKISPTLRLREALHIFQRNCITSPGLVAEGRDMTSEVFTDAIIKIFLDSSPEERARRRLLDEEKSNPNKNHSFDGILEDIKDRDIKDRNRRFGALTVVADAYFLDNTNLSQEETFKKVISFCDDKLSQYF